jgi:flagellar biosynthesis component FlhA
MFFNVLTILTNVNIYFVLGFFVVLAVLAAVPSIVVLLFRLPLMLLMLLITSIQKLCRRFNKQENSQMATQEDSQMATEEEPANACKSCFEKKAARTVGTDVIYMPTPQSASDRPAMVRSHAASIGYAADRAYQRHSNKCGTTSADWRQMKGRLESTGKSPLARREVSPVGSR